MGQEASAQSFLVFDVSAPGNRFLGFTGRDATALKDSIQNARARSFALSRMANVLWDAVFETMRQGSPNPLALQALLAALLCELVACAGRQKASGSSRLLDEVIRRVDASLDTRCSLRELAAAAGLSPSHFISRFKRETGMPPMDFVARRKIDHAKRLLTESRKSVTRIAMELGFSSSQHFCTAFRRFGDFSPSEYRRLFGPQGRRPKAD
jgi:AraC family transcriptional regulator